MFMTSDEPFWCYFHFRSKIYINLLNEFDVYSEAHLKWMIRKRDVAMSDVNVHSTQHRARLNDDGVLLHLNDVSSVAIRAVSSSSSNCMLLDTINFWSTSQQSNGKKMGEPWQSNKWTYDMKWIYIITVIALSISCLSTGGSNYVLLQFAGSTQCGQEI